MKRILFLVVGITMTNLVISQTVPQELVSSAGDSFSNATYQLDWSVGECVTATHSAGDYVITQGFHQNTYIITSVEDLHADIEMSVYPNPTSDIINVNLLGFKNLSGLKYTITDLSGKVLQTSDMLSDLEQINFSSYVNGTYLISITQTNKLIKSFQIIKK